MDERLKKLFSAMNAEDAKLLKSLLENMSSTNLQNVSQEEVEKRLEVTRRKIKEIEKKALKKLEERKSNPQCSYCRSKASDVEHMLQASTNAYICNACIVACYEQLQKLQQT